MKHYAALTAARTALTAKIEARHSMQSLTVARTAPISMRAAPTAMPAARGVHAHRAGRHGCGDTWRGVVTQSEA